MTRYFLRYNTLNPMVEVSYSEALANGRFVALVDAWPTQYHRMSSAGGAPHGVIYPDWDEPEVPLQHHRRQHPGVRAEIQSPVVRRPANGVARTILAPHWWDPPPPVVDATLASWKTWYVDEQGQIEKLLVSTCDAEGYRLREDYHGPDGELRDYSVYRYDHQGFLIDRVTYGPDGSVLMTEDA